MAAETVETLVIGGGQAGLAMSAHLGRLGLEHLVLERGRIAERWRSWRWDSLVANGPAWHDRFPDQLFEGIDPDAFPGKEEVARYFEIFAERIAAPIRCGVEATRLRRAPDGARWGARFLAETTQGEIAARNVVLATGPFQKPLIPACAPDVPGLTQLHSTDYRNPGQLPEGAVLVVGGGSSGAQIAEELIRAGRRVFLSVGPHDRPPRRYRGRDYCWWLGVLGKWDAKAPAPGTEHVTIAVSGAYGGRTMDFRRLAEQGARLLGRVRAAEGAVLEIAPDLAGNIARGDANYLSVLREADAYADEHGLDLPPEPEAHVLGPLPDCAVEPVRRLDLAAEGVGSIVWATGFGFDFGWVELDAFDAQGRPRHVDGASDVPGLYFLGLPWLTSRGSSFIWGAWRDAGPLAERIAARG